MVETYASSWLFYAVIMVFLTGLALAWAAVATLNQRCHRAREARHHSTSALPHNDGNAIG